MEYKDELLERFLRYVSFDTQSDPDSQTFPSTAKQLMLLNHLVEELLSLGLAEVEIDPHGYVTATLPASEGYAHKPVIGWLAHVDTSPDMVAQGLRPQVIDGYEGGDIALGSSGEVMKVSEFPELKFFTGHTLITTEGITLLGADDKAGVAEIVTAAHYLLRNPEVKHGKIRIAFTPDEEVGRGVDFFDLEAFGAQYAYTVDGGFEGELEFENFNAARAQVIIQGRNIHPGYAKDKMINALRVAMQYDAQLPPGERPEATSGYEGFFHLVEMAGNVERAQMEYIVRDHDRERFEARKLLMQQAAQRLNLQYGAEILTLRLEDQYYNMKERIVSHPQLIEKALQAIRLSGATPRVVPIRGGTDGARLSYMGLPCPNLFTGGMNYHGRYEYCSLDSMQRATQTLIHLANLWAQ